MDNEHKTAARIEHEKYQAEQAELWRSRINALMGRVNAGYVVTDVMRGREPHLAYVLAGVCGEFMTWAYNADSDGFTLGHYFGDRNKAREDLADRSGCRADWLL